MKRTSKFDPETGADWGFPMPSAGRHTGEFEEGIDIIKNEETGVETAMIPVRIQGGDSHNIPFRVFTALNGSSFTKMKLESLIVCAGLGPAFDKKFPGDVEADDMRVVNQLQMDLPGKLADFELEVNEIISKKSGNKMSVVNVIRILKATGAKAPVSESAKKTTDEADSGW